MLRTRIRIFSNEIASAQTIELRVPSKGGVEEYFSFVKQWNVQNQLNVFVQASPTQAAICLLFRVSEQELTLVASPLQFFFLLLTRARSMMKTRHVEERKKQ